MSAVGKLIGPLLVGAYLNAIMYGVLLVQVSFLPSTSSKCHTRDRSKGAFLFHCLQKVAFLLAVETVSVWADFAVVWEPLVAENGGSLSLILFSLLIKHKGSARALEVSPIGLRADPIVTSLISTTVQIYMGWRIRRLTASTLLFGIIVLFAFASQAAAISSTILLSKAPAYVDFDRLNGSIYSWLTSSAVADVIIAVSLVVYLMKSRGNSAATDSVIDRIIRITVQTGALTSVAAITDLLTFAFSRSTIQFIWDFSLGKLYTISLLSGLNARTKWAQMLDQDDGIVSFIHYDPSSSGSSAGRAREGRNPSSTNSFALVSTLRFNTSTQSTVPEQNHLSKPSHVHIADGDSGFEISKLPDAV
ncbi:hypothetical protein D9757_011856 [Collybiopsis confluens]|uniref:DUF6534 domain-containing protein n=1 Tax=Collybiopsis confluens TaxID=2823264 RepID=A0A8H5D3N1_9AGAR|nr:hypothetical protein D9757_011856 [Collybiopsis confluens]